MTKRVKRRAQEPRKFRVYALMTLCGLVLVAGFFLAGRQHFSSMDYGMKNSKLRKQIDDLEAQKRQLILTREMAQTPAELARVAKKIGLNATAAVEPAVPALAKAEMKAPVQTEEKALVVKTASVEKTVPVTTAATLKTDNPIRNAIKKAVVTAAE